MDLSWAGLPPGGDPALAEWLEGPRAVRTSRRWQCWRRTPRAGASAPTGGDKTCWLSTRTRPALVDEAEECMRGAGLWPWPGTDKQGSS